MASANTVAAKRGTRRGEAVAKTDVSENGGIEAISISNLNQLYQAQPNENLTEVRVKFSN